MPINQYMSNEKTSPVLNVQNLTVKFDKFTAVDDISFTVNPGEVLGILGGNGAGKSTTLKVLGGVLKPTQGTIIVDGNDLKSSREAYIAKQLTGYCPDVGGLISGATPREHVKLLLTLRKKPELYDKGIELIESFGLTEFIDSPASGFSHGMSRRLSVALAALASEKFLILDEPFDGVDPLGVDAINSIIARAKSLGLAIIVSTHLQDLLVNVADRIMIMKKSRIIVSEPSVHFQGEEGKQHYQALLSALDSSVDSKESN